MSFALIGQVATPVRLIFDMSFELIGQVEFLSGSWPFHLSAQAVRIIVDTCSHVSEISKVPTGHSHALSGKQHL